MRSASLSACFISSIDSVIFELGELADAPVLQHPVVQEILVDRGQLVLERDVEKLDDLCVALHGSLPLKNPKIASTV